MIERRSDQAADVDLRNRTAATGCARARGCNLPLHERNHLRNRRMMRVRNQCLRPGIRDRPQDARRFRNAEREVEPRNRAPRPTLGLLGLDCGDHLRA